MPWTSHSQSRPLQHSRASLLPPRPGPPTRAAPRCRTASGGVSVEEFAEVNRQASDYSLRLVLVARDSGADLADVDVTVRSLPARDVVLEHRTDGPLLLAALRPGRYEVSASFTDMLPGAPTTVARVITVPRSGLAQAVLYFDTSDTVGTESPPEYRLN